MYIHMYSSFTCTLYIKIVKSQINFILGQTTIAHVWLRSTTSVCTMFYGIVYYYCMNVQTETKTTTTTTFIFFKYIYLKITRSHRDLEIRS